METDFVRTISNCKKVDDHDISFCMDLHSMSGHDIKDVSQQAKRHWASKGMMNNCWFKVKTNICQIHKGEVGILFEHPTQPGSQSGGWMAKERHLESVSRPQLNKHTNYQMSRNTIHQNLLGSLSRVMSMIARNSSANIQEALAFFSTTLGRIKGGSINGLAKCDQV